MYSSIKNGILLRFDERDLDVNGCFVIPNSVVEIANNAFHGGYFPLPDFTKCTKLKKVVIPQSVKKIGENAFCNNTGLETVELDEGLSELAFMAFCDCENLKQINLPASLKILGESCFSGCKKLQVLDIPSNIEKVGVSVFYNSGIKQLKMCGKSITDQELIEALSTTYPFIQYAVNNNKFIPKFNVAMLSTPPKDVPGYFKFSKTWKKVQNAYTEKWAEFLKDNYEYDELPEEVVSNLYTACLALGLFNEGPKQKETLQFIVDNIFEYNPTELHQTFSEVYTAYDGYNEEFANFFMGTYRAPEMIDGVKVRFLEKLVDDEIISYVGRAYNEWDYKVKAAYPNRITVRHGARQSESNSLTEKMVVDLFDGIVYYIGIHDGNSNLAEMVSPYGYTQEEFDELQEAYDKGKTIGEDDMILAIAPDDATAGVVYKFLSKDDEEGAVLGEKTNCCQTINDAGKECLLYGMSKPNSGFIKFSLDGKIVGQSWIWYNQLTKHACLDNIEIPTVWTSKLEESPKLEKSFIDCIKRLSKGIVLGMNENGQEVDMVSIGAGYNDLKAIKQFKRYEVKENLLPADYDGYSDAKKVLYIVDENICQKQKFEETSEKE